MKARMHEITVFLVIGLASSAAALSPIGPSQAVIGEDHWGLGVNLGFQSTDLVADGTYFEYQSPTRQTKGKIALDDIESTSSFVQIGFGLSPEWDVYGCIGATNAKGYGAVNSTMTQATHAFEHGERFSINGDHEVAWGVGTRFTLGGCEELKWGGMAQMTWQSPKGNSTWSTKDTGGGGYTIDGNWELETWELIVAFGPTFVHEDVQFYCGPFLQLIRGDMDFTGTYSDIATGTDTGTASTSQDLEEEAMVGAYAGMQMDLYENMLFYVDGQFTGKAWGAGIGIILQTQ